MPVTLETIREYYDQNTRLFLAFGGKHKAQNIHRALWANSVHTLEDALNVSNEMIRAEIETIAPTHARIADLGCGVGAGLFYIVPRLKEPIYAVGVTLSSLQAQLAGGSVKEAKLQDKIFFTESDFTRVPLESGSLDAIYSVEAVVHALESENYFREASRLLRTGGKLILLDDYRASHPLSYNEEAWLKSFMDGWHVPGVRTVEEAVTFAEKYGLQLVRNDELTSLLRLRNLPDLLARAIRSIGNHLPIRHAIVPSMLGSMALQQCLFMKVVEYRFLVFTKFGG
jgi:cyclopropane fatty-acyl-phospholipid synthase-like methyltransferase